MGMTYIILTTAKKAIENGDLDALRRLGVPPRYADMIRSMSMDDIEYIDRKEPDLFRVKVDNDLLVAMLEQMGKGATPDQLEAFARQWEIAHQFDNVIPLRPPKDH